MITQKRFKKTNKSTGFCGVHLVAQYWSVYTGRSFCSPCLQNYLVHITDTMKHQGPVFTKQLVTLHHLSVYQAWKSLGIWWMFCEFDHLKTKDGDSQLFKHNVDWVRHEIEKLWLDQVDRRQMASFHWCQLLVKENVSWTTMQSNL